MLLSMLLTRSIVLAAATQPSDARVPPDRLERGYWLHASLSYTQGRGYWHRAAPFETVPTPSEIRAAAGLLCGEYGANCLYLMYHLEIPIEQFESVMRTWREACPAQVEIIPALVLRMYNKEQTPVFSPDELRRLTRFCKAHVSPARFGWYDVMPDRPQEADIAILAEEFPRGLVRIGIQPDEKIDPRCSRVVQDTWSAFCHGKTHDDWYSPGFGRQTLAGWVAARRESPAPVSWDLIVVAWDYQPTQRGEYPGYDDANRNMPLPAGRNRLAARMILESCAPAAMAGFSSDLFILQANSRSRSHDGPDQDFYSRLRKGEPYRGYSAGAFDEGTAIYRELRGNRLPQAATAPASSPAD